MQYKQTWEGIISHIADNLEQHKGELSLNPALKAPASELSFYTFNFLPIWQQHDSEYQNKLDPPAAAKTLTILICCVLS